MDHPAAGEPGVGLQHLVVKGAEEGHLADLLDGDEPRAQSVVHVVAVVGDLVGEVGELRLEARMGLAQKALTHLPQLPGTRRGAVLENPLPAFEGEVEAVETGILLLQPVHHPQRLDVVLEATPLGHAVVEGLLPGVAEGGVPKIVGQGDGLGEILVEPHGTGDGAADLRHLEGVGETGAVEIPLVVDEDLGLVLEAAEGGAVDHPVTIALVLAPAAGRRLRPAPATTGGIAGGVGGGSAIGDGHGLPVAGLTPPRCRTTRGWRAGWPDRTGR